MKKTIPANLIKTVASAGTAEPLSASHIFALKLTVQAIPANTDDVIVGSSDVLKATGNGIILTAYQSETFENVFLDEIYVDVAVNGEGVSAKYEIKKSILS